MHARDVRAGRPEAAVAGAVGRVVAARVVARAADLQRHRLRSSR